MFEMTEHAELGQALQLIRLRSVNGIPVIYEKRYLSHALCDGITKEMATGSLYDAFQEILCLVVGHADQRVRAVFPNREEKSLLGLSQATACLRVEGKGYLADVPPIHDLMIYGSAGVTRESMAGSVIWRETIPEGQAVSYIQFLGVGRRCAGGWTDIRGSVVNGFTTNPSLHCRFHRRKKTMGHGCLRGGLGSAQRRLFESCGRHAHPLLGTVEPVRVSQGKKQYCMTAVLVV